MKTILLLNFVLMFQATLISQPSQQKYFTGLPVTEIETLNKQKGFNLPGLKTAPEVIAYQANLFNLQEQNSDEAYNEYYNKYNTAKNWRKVGGYVNLLGLLQLVVGSGLVVADRYGWETSEVTYTNLLISSAAFFAVGMPLWIWQNDRVRNNKKEMDKIKPVHLSISGTRNGAGLLVHF